MMSISKISRGNLDYYIVLQATDYYLNDSEPPGCWIGSGSEHLHLPRREQRKAFTNVLNGFSPNGKRPLTHRQRRATRKSTRTGNTP